MIDFELFARIKNCHEQKGLSASQIAEELGLDPRTVSKWLRESRFRQRAPVLRASKLDPFKTTIVRMLETHPYSAAQVLQKVREEGFDGGRNVSTTLRHLGSEISEDNDTCFAAVKAGSWNCCLVPRERQSSCLAAVGTASDESRLDPFSAVPTARSLVFRGEFLQSGRLLS